MIYFLKHIASFSTTDHHTHGSSHELVREIRAMELDHDFKRLLSIILNSGLDAGTLCREQYDGDACSQSVHTRELYQEAIARVIERAGLDPSQEGLALTLAYHAFNEKDQPGMPEHRCGTEIQELLGSR